VRIILSRNLVDPQVQQVGKEGRPFCDGFLRGGCPEALGNLSCIELIL